MRQYRFRLRTLMVIIAFVALALMVILQTFELRRMAVRAELYRAVSEQRQAEAFLARNVAEAARDRALQSLRQAEEARERAIQNPQVKEQVR
jgi:hypothetical protein